MRGRASRVMHASAVAPERGSLCRLSYQRFKVATGSNAGSQRHGTAVPARWLGAPQRGVSRAGAADLEPERLPPSADLLQSIFEAWSVPLVGLRGTPHRRRLLRRQRPDHARGRADDQGIFGILLAFGNDRARADDAAAAYPRAVHDDGAHSDQRVVFKRATVQDHVVADRAVAADRQRKAGVGVAGAIVLHVGAFADLDPL